MTKIVYNACYGGFGLSHEAVMRYAELKGITLYANNERGFITHYTTVPWEEYNRIRSKEENNPIGSNRFQESKRLYFSERLIERTDPALVQVVEELGDRASGQYAELCIEEVPEGTLYRIDEYDGFESIETKGSYDWKIA